jgi:hypothetical protein
MTQIAADAASPIRNIHKETGVSIVATWINGGLSIALFAAIAIVQVPVASGNMALVAVAIGVLWGGAVHYAGRQERRIASILAFLASFIWTGFTAGLLAMIGASLGSPFIDPQLATFDRMIGFDHRHYVIAITSIGWLPGVLNIIYMQTVPIMILAGFLHALRQDRADLREFTFVYTATLAATIVISFVTPAIGTFAFYGFGEDLTASLPPLTGTYHLEDLARIRAGNYSLDPMAMNGIVTFPSFHMAMSLVMAATFRHVPVIRWIAVIMSVITIMSTIICGGHYIADLVGGAAITWLIMVAAARRYAVPLPVSASTAAA